MDVDRLPGDLQVVRLVDASFGDAVPRGPRAPHRHDYHELLWTRSGSGTHSVDGERFPMAPGTLTVIGRGQVHVLERRPGSTGAVVRFGDELVLDAPAWLIGRRGALTVEVPPAAIDALEATIATLAAESARPADAYSGGLSGISCPRCCCGSSAGTTARRPSATPTATRSCTGASPPCSSASSRATTTPPSTPMRWRSPPRRSRAR